jgi:hypothetical protein
MELKCFTPLFRLLQCLLEMVDLTIQETKKLLSNTQLTPRPLPQPLRIFRRYLRFPGKTILSVCFHIVPSDLVKALLFARFNGDVINSHFSFRLNYIEMSM